MSSSSPDLSHFTQVQMLCKRFVVVTGTGCCLTIGLVMAACTIMSTSIKIDKRNQLGLYPFLCTQTQRKTGV